MIAWWQELPLHIDPIASAAGSFAVGWYALCALFGWLAAYFIFKRRLRGALSAKDVGDLFFWLFFGTLLGARLGFAILYAPGYFFADPLRLVSLSDEAGEWVGLRGLSFHGGLIGAVLTLCIFSARRGLRGEHFWRIADGLAFAAPAISFFGRIGNFLNGELPGRPLQGNGWWGMRFAQDDVMLRHPSALYEALLEGVFLFTFLLLLGERLRTPGSLAAAYLFGYGVLRFLAEYYRAPDPWLGTLAGGLSLGQLLSLGCIGAGIGLGAWIFRKKRAIIRND